METMSEVDEAAYTDAEADAEQTLFAAERESDAEPEPEPEPEPDAEPEPDTDEPEPPPIPAPPTPGVTPEAFERHAKKVATAFGRYTKVVSAEFGELADDLTPCPLCPELHPAFVNVHDAGRLPAEVDEVVRLFLGMTPEADYLSSPDTAKCDRCDGLGRVRSGSRVANYELLTCPRCTGTGFYPPPSGGSHVPVTGSANGANGLDEPFRAEVGDGDPWGSPRLLANGTENPNYGRMPQYKDPNLP